MTKNWEKEKEKMHELYMARNMKLASVIEIMTKQYNFQASERAYKQKFKEWQWFKKTQRSQQHVHQPIIKQERHSPSDDNSEHSSPRAPEQPHVYRMHHRGPSRGIPSPVEQGYDQYTHIQFDPNNYPPVSGADMEAVYSHAPHNGQGNHIRPPTATGGMTLGPYGRGVSGSQVSLPSVSTLQHAAFHRASFNENLREAERRVDVGQFEGAQAVLEGAARNLHWLRDSNN
ncbi:hypothetical protein K440DRAFT_661104 [Wilcoxina mikolae CBS 423.85]|nr:hypothetical protein K440DRAFT_661104 [Wilcoxina mikolae CBS 423.85]